MSGMLTIEKKKKKKDHNRIWRIFRTIFGIILCNGINYAANDMSLNGLINNIDYPKRKEKNSNHFYVYVYLSPIEDSDANFHIWILQIGKNNDNYWQQ